MKFVLNKRDFIDALNSVIHVAYNKSQKTILECVLINAVEGYITLNAFDTVTAIEAKREADVEEEGISAIPAKLLYEVVSKMPEGEITLESSESGVTISCSNSCIKLQVMDASQFPAFPEVKGTSFEIAHTDLKELIDGTIFAVYSQPDKPVYTGLMFESDGDLLNVIAIDGVRMARRSVRKEKTNPFKIIIPSKAMREVGRMLSDDENKKIRFYMDLSACFMVMDDVKVYTRLLMGDFMNYRNMADESKIKSRVKINVRLLEESINMVSVMTRELATNPVKIEINAERAKINANSEYGHAEDIVPVELNGDVVSISLNAKSFMDLLRAIDEDEVMLMFETDLKPFFIKQVEGDDFWYLMVPLTK